MKIERDTLARSMKCGMLDRTESARSGRESQSNDPNLEAGRLALLALVCRAGLVLSGLQQT